MRTASRRAFVKVGLVLFEITRAVDRRNTAIDVTQITTSTVRMSARRHGKQRFQDLADLFPHRLRVCDSKANLFCFSVASLRFPPDFSLTNQRGDSFSVPGVNLEAKG
jgi:uncharacterized protein YcaQ